MSSRKSRRNRHRPTRIGHAEREEAISLLSEHHSDGRLDPNEFEQRVSAALQARTAEEVRELFEDLPGPVAGEGKVPSRRQPDLYELRPTGRRGKPARPWYASWWLLPAAAAVAGLSILHWSAIIWIVMAWLVIGWPIHNKRNPPLSSLRRRRGVMVHAVLTDWEVGQVERELRRHRKAHAITMYRRFTGASFAEASEEVERLRRQVLPPR